ncbi:staphylococcal-like nuclease CAN1 [Rutidosis leptorrhynchoides]|uniref:staphylococcal-like nuclease CAN1 n=1 Tax=Rutidosis leptorrhynchoides TaxID=125765 RepID=UPI003A9A59B6
MGNNAVRPVAAGDQYSSNTSTTTAATDQPLRHSTSAAGISALAQDLYHFESTSQVPDDLSKHVTSTKETQSKWYEKISNAWRESKPPPNTPEQVSNLLIRILNLNNTHPHDLQGLLSFYDLPFPRSLVELTTCDPPLVAKGLKFSLHTLPVDPKAVQDGDGMIVYVSAQESLSDVPQEIQIAMVERNKARAERNYGKADALLLQIKDAGYGLPVINNEQILAQKYRIRLRGIDAPEMSMPYGKEAKDELVKIIGGKCLTILIFDQDQYGRHVGDIYCNGIFVQESMLKKGLAWHYTFHDRRQELAKWEKDARAKRIGLWASSKPEKPWEWRKKQKEEDNNIVFIIMGFISILFILLLALFYFFRLEMCCSIVTLVCIYLIYARYG